jgi:hypothetical protein
VRNALGGSQQNTAPGVFTHPERHRQRIGENVKNSSFITGGKRRNFPTLVRFQLLTLGPFWAFPCFHLASAGLGNEGAQNDDDWPASRTAP